MKNTFLHGVHPLGKKSTAYIPLKEISAGEKVRIPLAQHIGAPPKLLVEVGDSVKAGTMLAKAESFVSANIFSSVSGKVTAIERGKNAGGMPTTYVVIENDFRYEKELLPILTAPTREEIVARIQEAGIVGLGGACFPTHVKFAAKTPIDTLVINAVECEPYITCDNRLMLEYTQECVEGIKYMMTGLGVDKAIIGIEDNKPEAISRMTAATRDCSGITVSSVKTKYPQGAEKQLIYAVTKRKVAIGALPSDVGVVVDNIHTAFSIYRAIALGEPLYWRAMTIAGNGIKNKGNYIAVNGISFEELLHYVEPSGEEIVKILCGGPMMGTAQPNLKASTAKGVSCVLFLAKGEIPDINISACINCARCAKACPMNLLPMFIDSAAQAGDAEMTNRYGAMGCIECGACAFTCPAHRPLVQTMKKAKALIRSSGVK